MLTIEQMQRIAANIFGLLQWLSVDEEKKVLALVNEWIAAKRQREADGR